MEHKERGKYVLEQILPIILNDGLYNKNEDIAKFSLNTISKLLVEIKQEVHQTEL